MILINWVLIPLAIFLAITLLLGVTLFIHQRKKEEYEDTYLPDYLEKFPKPGTYQIIGLSPIDPYKSPDWQNMMAMISKRLKNHQIQKIIFLNGTFMGEDPFDVLKALPYLPISLKKFIIRLSRFLREVIFKDGAQFTRDYLETLQRALEDVQIISFPWSSTNHHLGRLEAAKRLLELLASFEDQRILLIAHSHGGQCLALLTQLLSGAMESDRPSDLEKVKNKKLDLLTLGMPPRYRFHLGPNLKCLHLINHKTKYPLGGHLTGLFNTRDGDYIQQWGVDGSDNISPIPEVNKINKSLQEKLGPGMDPLVWKNLIKKRARVPKDGHSFLIDYDDNGFFIHTLLGHAIYTRKKVILKNFKILVDFFY